MLIDTDRGYKKNSWRYFLIITILFLSHSITLAQTGTIKSIVLDKITKDPLAGANAIIKEPVLGQQQIWMGKLSLGIFQLESKY